MLIVLFRHGPAADRDAKRWPDDRERPLTERGRDRTLRAAHGLVRLIGAPTMIYTSALTRAADTAQILARAAGIDRLDDLESLEPGGARTRTYEALAKHAGDSSIVVLVGHEPDLGELAGSLIGSAPLALKKAGACAIEVDGRPRAGAGELRWFLQPSILRQLVKKKARA